MSVSENEYSIRPSEWSSLWSKGDSTFSLKKSETLLKQDAKEGNSYASEQKVPVPEHIPDARLSNWEKWLNIHKKQQDKLSNILKRPPQCLLMNMNFNNLHINQQKQLMTEASEFTFCDKYRGHPSFWTTDNGAHGNSNKLGLYQPIQKRYDRSLPTSSVNCCLPPTDLEYVGISDAIMKEKGLLAEQCLPPPKVNWEKSLYVTRRKEGLKDKLELFQEHTPQTVELAVIGNKITRDESRVVNFEIENIGSDISHVDRISNSSDVSEELEPSVLDTITVAIDDEIVDNSSKVWIVCFRDSLTDEFYEKSINIKNPNDCCIRYSWEEVMPPWVKSSLPLKQIRNLKHFYFNKNNSIILPQSSKKLNFYFESGKSGVFIEKWKLYLTNAPDREECIMVELQSVVSEKPGTDENLQVIDSYIESCARYSMASKTVKEILERSRPGRPTSLPYDWMFMEEQIFLFNNPGIFYDSKYVTLLKEMYKDICEGPWDFSVQTLRKKLLELALNEDVTEKLNEFTAIVCHLMKPKLTFSFTNEKHKTVYELLCCFIDKMENESNSVKHILKIPLKIASSLNVINEEALRKTSRVSKFNTKDSVTSKKSNRKTSLIKTRLSVEKTSIADLEESSQLRQKQTSGDYETMSHELEEKIKKQEYLEALYIKTYNHLCVTVDNISAVIDSFDAQKEKRALLSLKLSLLYNNF